MSTRASAWILTGLLVLGCATPLPPAQPATIRVEILQGVDPIALAPLGLPPELHVIADLSAAGSIETAEAKRRAAARLLAKSSPPVQLQIVGSELGACSEPRVPPASVEPAGMALAEHVLKQPSGGGSAIGTALEAVVAKAHPEGGRRRVVIFSDFAAPCGSDLCEPAQALVASGGQLDLVSLGDGTIPPCLLALRNEATQPPPWLDLAPRWLTTGFEVSLHSPDEDVAPAPRLAKIAAGRAGGEVAVAPGTVKVVVELDPPVVVYPLRVAGASRTTIRILDAPVTSFRRVFVTTDEAGD